MTKEMIIFDFNKEEFEIPDFNKEKCHTIFEFLFNGAVGQIVLLWHLVPHEEPRFNGYVTFKTLFSDIDYEDLISVHGGITYQEYNTLGFDHFHLSDSEDRGGLDFRVLVSEICSVIKQVNELHEKRT